MTEHNAETLITITTILTGTGITESEMDVERFLKEGHVSTGDHVLLFERRKNGL